MTLASNLRDNPAVKCYMSTYKETPVGDMFLLFECNNNDRVTTVRFYMSHPETTAQKIVLQEILMIAALPKMIDRAEQAQLDTAIHIALGKASEDKEVRVYCPTAQKRFSMRAYSFLEGGSKWGTVIFKVLS